MISLNLTVLDSVKTVFSVLSHVSCEQTLFSNSVWPTDAPMKFQWKNPTVCIPLIWILP